MLGAAIIVFRETFEAALLIGIIAAATRGMFGHWRWIGAGVGAGLTGAVMAALLTGRLATAFNGVGQEIFNAFVLGLAVLMLAWHNIWMSTHGAELAGQAKRIGGEIRAGTQQLSAVFFLVALAVLREGSETVLFLYGLISGGESAMMDIVGGGGGGLLAGILFGAVMYFGMLKIPVRWFFSVTSVLIALLAAGMASKMAHYLLQADLLAGSETPLWNISRFLPTDSALGTLLHALAGYEAAPSAMQVIFYAITLFAIYIGMRWARSARAVG